MAVNINGENIYACKKGDLALLKRIPKPESGYRYLDVVRIGEPIGKTLVRDDEIFVYESKEIVFKSNISTYQFDAVIPTPKDYFNLMARFSAPMGRIDVPFPFNDPEFDLKKGFGAFKDINQAKLILEKYVKDNQDRQINNISLIAG